MNRIVTALALAAILGAANFAQAAVTGSLKFQGAQAVEFPAATVDVYFFDITNTTGSPIDTLDSPTFTVSGGTFVQDGGNFNRDTTAFPTVSIFTVGDSFFVLDRLAAPGVNVDTTTELSAEAIADLDNVWVADGTTETVAVLAVTQGATVSFNFGEAFALSGGQNVGTIQGEGGPVIPAPAALPAGLALMGIVGLRRRRG